MFLYIHLRLLETNHIQSKLEYPLTRFVAQAEAGEQFQIKSHEYYAELDEYLGTGANEKAGNRLSEMQIDVGMMLAKHVMPDTVLSGLKEIQDSKADHVYLTIFVPHNELDRHPWELVGHPDVLRKLMLEPPVTIIRGVSSPTVAPNELQGQNPLKFLFASSAPFGETPPNIEDEITHLDGLVTENKASYPVDLSVQRNIEYDDLVVASQKLKPAVLHLSLHGHDDHLIFKQGDHRHRIDPHRFVDDITKNDNLGLVFLNVCHSAGTNRYNEASLAKALVNRGVPTVIGMSSEIADRASYYFSKDFYTRFFLDYKFSESFAASIEKLRTTDGYDRILWSVPMLLQTIDLNLSKLLGVYSWPVEYIEEMLSLIEEFDGAFMKLRRSELRDGRDIERKTKHLRMILLSLTEHIQDLGENLPMTLNNKAMSDVLSILNQKDRALRMLQYFQEALNDILATPRNDRVDAEIQHMFLSRGGMFLSEILELQGLLKAAIY